MLDNRIRFRHLQGFLAVAQHRRVGRAADALSITQPALSKTLRELEVTLGSQLFRRDKKGMRLTRSGEVFLQHAAASVASLRHGVESIRIAASNGDHGVVAGALPNVASGLMPLVVGRFKGRSPQCIVRVLTGENASLLSLLRLGELDFVVGRLAQPEHMVGLMFEHLYLEPLVFVVRPKHRLLKARRFKPSMVCDYPCLLPPSGTIIRDELDRFLIAEGMPRPKNVVETLSIAFGRGYTSNSDAVWFVPRGVAEPELASRTLVELPIAGMRGPVGITTKEGANLSAPGAAMVAVLRAVVQELHGCRE
jgi:LysR family transcriptional regulator, pca operon transcriptional activator